MVGIGRLLHVCESDRCLVRCITADGKCDALNLERDQIDGMCRAGEATFE